MPAGDAEHATRQLWRHYSGVQSSSPVSGAVGAVGGRGGGQGLVCGFSPDLLADLLVPEHAELEMLDLTVGQVRFIGQPVAIVTGGAITSALGLTDPARRATAAAAPAMAAASDAGEGAAPSSCEPSESRSELRALDVVFVLVGAPAAGDEEEYSRAVQAARRRSSARHYATRSCAPSSSLATAPPAVAEEEAAAAAEAAVEAAAVAVGAATAAVAGTR